MKTIKVLFFLSLVCLSFFFTCHYGCNEDGNPKWMQTRAEKLDKAQVPNWRERCNDSYLLIGAVSAVPLDGKVLEVISCIAILIKLRDKCYIITSGFRNKTWSQATCP